MDILNSWLLISFTVYESFTQTLVLNHGHCVFGDVCKADKECFLSFLSEPESAFCASPDPLEEKV